MQTCHACGQHLSDGATQCHACLVAVPEDQVYDLSSEESTAIPPECEGAPRDARTARNSYAVFG